jgi:transposase-like protein
MTVNHIPPVHTAPRSRRPSTYTEEVAERILDRVAETNESLRQICKLPGMPKPTTLARWRIADDGDRDWRPETNEDGVMTLTVNKEHLLRTRQRLEWRLNLLRNLAPKGAPQGPQGLSNATAPGIDGALLLDQRVLEGHQLRPSYTAYERAMAERR